MSSSAGVDSEDGRSEEPSTRSSERCPDLDPMAALDTLAVAVADARKALRELRQQTSTLELITNQLHRHAILVQLIQNALDLNLERPEPSQPTRQNTEPLASVGDLSLGVYTLATVKIFKTSSDHQEPHCLICLEDYIEGAPIIVLPCHDSHNYHLTCLTHWARHSKRLTCPLCRSPFDRQSSNDYPPEI
ncbi:hypothetical protein PTTG_03503 [Puccinia triticina 1-1 BBBD Race 1]|uniref:RING-type domain-containing protein n=1 Tax=Puccinia triticina (isolate 1-1 / race 1 (BBBD)) TaxID=630390 RepID=A0A180GX60_PUCT1|nr:hypothetical protein PTTG_03503 [Puccinia triticina 1-1 BBBD Race 1]WAR63029.1 hypothetical protein PtB15_18B111 [Puccinia triticina]